MLTSYQSFVRLNNNSCDVKVTYHSPLPAGNNSLQGVITEMDKRAQNLGYGIGVGLREVLQGSTSADDLSYYSSWSAKFVNWWLRRSFLHHAVEERSLKSVKHFLKTDSKSINQFDTRNFAPIHLAVLQDWPEGVRTLKVNGADLNLTHPAGLDPLTLALTEKKYQALRALLALGVDPKNTRSRFKLEILDEKMYPKVFPFLNVRSQKGKMIEIEQSPLAIAMMLSDIHAMELLIPSDMNQGNAWHENTDFVELIQSCQYPLLSAIHYTTVPKVLEYVINDKNVNQVITVTRNGSPMEVTPLSVALEVENKQAIKILLENGATITPISAAIFTKLFDYACEFEFWDYAKELIEKSSSTLSVNEMMIDENNTPVSPLGKAVLAKNEEIIVDLLKRGADPFQQVKLKGSAELTAPIIMAVQDQDENLISLILNERAKPRNEIPFGPKQKNAYTTLFEEIIRKILKGEAVFSVQRKNDDGDTFFNVIIDGLEHDMYEITLNMDWDHLRLKKEDYDLLACSKYDLSQKIVHLDDGERSTLETFISDAPIDERILKAGTDKYDDLTPLDKANIYIYTNGATLACALVNAFLKGNLEEFTKNLKYGEQTDTFVNDDPLHWWVYSAFLTNALNKIMPEVIPHFAARGQSGPDTLLRQKYPAFISTSKDISLAMYFYSMRNHPNLLLFDQVEGKDVSFLSHYPDKSEFVIVPKRLECASHQIDGKSVCFGQTK